MARTELSKEGHQKLTYGELRCPFFSQSKSVPVYCVGQRCDFDLWTTVHLPLEYRVRTGKSVLSGCALHVLVELWKVEHW